MPTSPLPLQRYWDLAAAPVETAALDAALELDLLAHLVAPASAAHIAQALALRPAAAEHLLDLLWSLRLLHRIAGEPPLYRCGVTARDHFVAGRPHYCGDAWRYRRRALAQSGEQLMQRLRQDPAATPAAPSEAGAWANAARVQIGQEQRALAVAAAREAVACVPGADAARRILDLGGGPGLIGIALVQDRPQASGVVFDWPETAAVARENIAAAGLAARMVAVGGDLATADIGAGYDLIWCSSVLHFVPDAAATIRKMHDALAPGGLLVMAHAEVPDDADAAARVLRYYLPMLLLGRRVTRQGQLAQALRAAGFAEVRGFDSDRFPLAPLHVLSARRTAP
ncbi:class I SAM-dependent methyltransferase [Achromobacter xylosoxidans]